MFFSLVFNENSSFEANVPIESEMLINYAYFIHKCSSFETTSSNEIMSFSPCILVREMLFDHAMKTFEKVRWKKYERIQIHPKQIKLLLRVLQMHPFLIIVHKMLRVCALCSAIRWNDKWHVLQEYDPSIDCI